MNKQRFEQLRNDLESAFGYIFQRHPNTQEVINDVACKLRIKYPELVGIYPLHKTKNNLDNVRKKLLESKDASRLTSYDGIENDLRSGNPNECLESIKILAKAIADSRRRSTFYSALQGKVLSSLKEMTNLEQFKKHLLAVNLSYNHACFLIRFHSLVLEYNQILHCGLPLRFFCSNFKKVQQVCEEDPMSWK